MKTNSQQRFMAAIIAIVLVVSNTMAQAPQAIPYQAVVRNALGNIVPNKLIGIRFGIRDLSAVGTRIYLEEQKATTNTLGLFVANVGQGTLVFGYQQLSVINWENGAKFLEVEIDTTGGTTYTSLGTQQLSSVPYALNAGNGVPVGTVCAFAGNNPPPGWLLCNGDTVNQTIYKNLFAVLGRVYGNGNGISTFKLPDYRGQFLRGVSGTSGVDPDANSRTIPPNSTGASATGVGSNQGDAFQGHWHLLRTPNDAPGNGGASFNNLGTSGSVNVFRLQNGLPSNSIGVTEELVGTKPISDGVHGTPNIASQTRPVNVYVNYIIKY